MRKQTSNAASEKAERRKDKTGLTVAGSTHLLDLKRMQFKATHGATAKSTPRHIRRALGEAERGMLEDLGGPDQATVKQKLMIKNCLRCLRIVYLIDEYLELEGVFAKPGEVQPCLVNIYDKYLGLYVRTLQALGMKTEAPKLPPVTVGEYIAAKGKVTP